MKNIFLYRFLRTNIFVSFGGIFRFTFMTQNDSFEHITNPHILFLIFVRHHPILTDDHDRGSHHPTITILVHGHAGIFNVILFHFNHHVNHYRANVLFKTKD
jgi:hypothetical protein